jgi:hypothetical protein
MQYSNPLAQQVAQHWENNFPKESLQLKKAGLFRESVENAARRAGTVLEQSAAKQLQPLAAEELALQEYSQPPST